MFIYNFITNMWLFICGNYIQLYFMVFSYYVYFVNITNVCRISYHFLLPWYSFHCMLVNKFSYSFQYI